MSQHDALLDELGLSPLWVRRAKAADSSPATSIAANEVLDAGDVERATGVTSTRGVEGASDIEGPAHTERTAYRSDIADRLDDARGSALTLTENAGVKPGVAPVRPSAVTDDAPPAMSDDGLEGYADMHYETVDFVAPADLDAPPVRDLSAFDFTALKAHVADCTACRLCEKRTQTVFGVGDENADWMIIGEAPGENEDRLGEPFVGQAGKLLDNMLRSLGLDRAHQVYIANVIKCRPPGNRDPQPDEVARCEPFLKRQVALVRPKVIVALGRFAAQTLLKTDATISSLRGRVHEYEGVPVIVSYHPAYLLRSLPDKSKAWTDLCLAQATYRKVAT